MELLEHRCKRCGGELNKIDGNRWKCPYCASAFDEVVVAKNAESLKALLDSAKVETVCNLRRNLYDAVNADFISNTDVKNACAELKKYLPDDFAANFYEVATGNNIKLITKLIRNVNVEENYAEISSAVRFLIKSLQTEYLLELNNLVERAYKSRDLALFEKYSTAISIEAEKVVSGVYETKMPREVFVAYSSKDMDKVSELVEVLEEQGLGCFVAARNLRHGKGSVENYEKLLCEAMDHCKTFVFVSSTNSRSFNCDALIKELPYIQQKDIESAPAEYKNNYGSMPHKLKKPRVEYRIEESQGFNAADAISNEFFDGYERVYSPEAVAERIAKQLVAPTVQKTAPNPEPKPEPKPVPIASPVATTSGQANVETLLKRAYIFLEDGDVPNAQKYCENLLDIDPENADAYLIKLMIDMGVKTKEELAKCEKSFEDNNNYKKAIRFGDEKFAESLKIYSNANKEHLEVLLQQAEEKRIQTKMQRKVKAKKLKKIVAIIASAVFAIALLGVFVAYPMILYMSGDYATYIKMYQIKEFEIPDGDTRIGYRAFDDCDSLISITIPDSVTSIGGYAFSGCSSLTSITIPDSVTSIGNDAFRNCSSLMKVHISDISAWCNISFGDFWANPLYYAENLYLNGELVTDLVIPDSVTSIGDYAFEYCDSLTSITIPDSVTSIGDKAFYSCSRLTKVHISDISAWCNISFGGYSANPLYYAENLYLNGELVTDLVIPDSVTSIGKDAFIYCSSLTSITIPDSVTSIGDRAFAVCSSLTSITIPDSVTSIGDDAFYGCSSLKTVYFTGTEEDWAAISVGSSNSDLTNATIIYNYVPEE